MTASFLVGQLEELVSRQLDSWSGFKTFPTDQLTNRPTFIFYLFAFQLTNFYLLSFS